MSRRIIWTGVAVVIAAGIVVGYLFGPAEAIAVVVCSVLLSAISAWSYIKGNETARDTDEYREQLISKRRPKRESDS
jgi:membrane protein implicated in regulation of membrane protease activity